MPITIYGAGYVGLVTAACFAEFGNKVLCMDIDAERIKKLQAGHCPIHEPGLPEMLAKHLANGHLKFTHDIAEAVAYGFYQFIAVGTPQEEDGSADLRHVLAVAKNIGDHLQDYRLIITKSTVPVGTADKVRQVVQTQLDARQNKAVFDVAANPEFLREGAAIADFMQCDRIIIGVASAESLRHLRRLYAPFDRDQIRMICMDIRSAELTKYAANAMLAAKISFMNELSQIAERFDADIEAIRRGIGSDPRIGPYFIHPGCGYGGSCFPKDIRALSMMAKAVDYQAPLVDSIDTVNQRQKQLLFQKISHHFKQQLQGKTFALWGLAFKPNTDDMREAPSRVLMEALWQAGAKVKAYDPAAMLVVQRIYGDRQDLELVSTPEAALTQADALVIVTEWRHFASPDFVMIKSQLKQPVIFDGRNIYDPEHLQELGFDYYAIGRGTKVNYTDA